MKFICYSFLFVCYCSLAIAQDVTFDDSSNDELVVKTAKYEVVLSKQHGAIQEIRHRSSSRVISLGNHSEHLWSATTPGREDDFVGSFDYGLGDGNTFSYEWKASNSTLTLHYKPGSNQPQALEVTAKIDFSKSKHIDFSLKITNGRPETLTHLSFPNDLLVSRGNIRRGLLPIIPGLVFEKGFFDERRSHQTQYPGWLGMFIPYVSMDLGHTFLTLYPIQKADKKVLPIDMGVNYSDDFVDNAYTLPFIMNTWISEGHSWSTPVIRLTLGQDFQATVSNFRKDNKWDQYPDVREKLGDDFDFVAGSMFYKFAFNALRTDFGAESFNEVDQLLATMAPAPGILHLVAYHGPFDHNFPDFFPPDPDYGTLEEYQAFHDRVHEAGYKVMPYINPTWWDLNSPTLQNLSGHSVDDLAVINEDQTPRYETYGETTGIVVSPNHTFVKERLATLMKNITETIPSDFIYEDQIGARPQPRDYNSTLRSPVSYLDTWIEHTRTYQDKNLGTEMGFDLLLETQSFFFGSTLLHRYFSDLDGQFGAGNYSDFPLTSLIAKDKAFFYPTNLGIQSSFQNAFNATYQLAMGLQLYNRLNDHVDFPGWIQASNLFQHNFVSGHAGTNMLSYETIEKDVTRSQFVNGEVVANWGNRAYEIEGHTLVPQGFFAQWDDGHWSGGTFSHYNGEALSFGDHILLERRNANSDTATLWHPVGGSTDLAVAKTKKSDPEFQYVVFAQTEDGPVRVPFTETEELITFEARAVVNGSPVKFWTLTSEVVLSAASPEVTKMVLYPNPLSSELFLQIQLPKPSSIELELLDLSGRAVGKWEKKAVTSDHSFDLSGTSLTSGILLAKIRMGDQTITKRLLVAGR